MNVATRYSHKSNYVASCALETELSVPADDCAAAMRGIFVKLSQQLLAICGALVEHRPTTLQSVECPKPQCQQDRTIQDWLNVFINKRHGCRTSMSNKLKIIFNY